MRYRPRLVDGELAAQLRSMGAVLLEGPKACGKTVTARQQAASEVLLDVDGARRAAARLEPSLVLSGATPRLLDEWQLVPSLWNHVRRAVDARGLPGQFILTGSAVPADDVTRHTGAGRVSRVRMRPLSLLEAGHSTGSISLGQLLHRAVPPSSESTLTLQELAELTARGGWPLGLELPLPEALRGVRNYLAEIERTDVTRVDGVARDPRRVARVLRTYARHVGTEAALTTMASDVDGADGAIHRNTVMDYLSALERLWIIEEQPAWSPHVRSRARIRLSSRRHFVDPSLAVAALRGSPERLLADVAWFGTLFESLVIRDLRVYAQVSDALVLHFRDNTGLEVDAIVECADGRWGAFEIKLGAGGIDAGAASLHRLTQKIDHGVCGPPAVLGVITGTGLAYRRPDGVQVIPIGALGP